MNEMLLAARSAPGAGSVAADDSVLGAAGGAWAPVESSLTTQVSRVTSPGPEGGGRGGAGGPGQGRSRRCGRSEEHTAELQSRGHLVCRPPLACKERCQ